MALVALPHPKDIVLWGMALMDPCTRKAIPGLLNGYLCTDVQEFTLTPSFTGGDRVTKSNGQGQPCRTVLNRRYFEAAAGELKACVFNPEMETVFNGGALYVATAPAIAPMLGKTVGGSGGGANGEEVRLWLEVWEALSYDDCPAGVPMFRKHIFPSGFFRPTLTGMKLGFREFTATLEDFQKVKPPDAYTGPFGDLPADFWSSIPAGKADWHYWLDVLTLPAAAANGCDELIPAT